MNNQGIQLQGNPTGGGESHLFIKPNLRVGNDQIAGAAAPAKQPSNVQISVGDGKSTATEQLQVRRALFKIYLQTYYFSNCRTFIRQLLLQSCWQVLL